MEGKGEITIESGNIWIHVGGCCVRMLLPPPHARLRYTIGNRGVVKGDEVRFLML